MKFGRELAAERAFADQAEGLAERVVGEGQAAVGHFAQDDVALLLDKAAIARFADLQFAVTLLQRADGRFELKLYAARVRPNAGPTRRRVCARP